MIGLNLCSADSALTAYAWLQWGDLDKILHIWWYDNALHTLLCWKSLVPSLGCFSLSLFLRKQTNLASLLHSFSSQTIVILKRGLNLPCIKWLIPLFSFQITRSLEKFNIYHMYIIVVIEFRRRMNIVLPRVYVCKLFFKDDKNHLEFGLLWGMDGYSWRPHFSSLIP